MIRLKAELENVDMTLIDLPTTLFLWVSRSIVDLVALSSENLHLHYVSGLPYRLVYRFC